MPGEGDSPRPGTQGTRSQVVLAALGPGYFASRSYGMTALDPEHGAGDGAGAGSHGVAVVARAHDPHAVGRAAHDLADVMAPPHHGAHLRRRRAAPAAPVPRHVEVRAAAALAAHPPAAPGPRTRAEAA